MNDCGARRFRPSRRSSVPQILRATSGFFPRISDAVAPRAFQGGYAGAFIWQYGKPDVTGRSNSESANATDQKMQTEALDNPDAIQAEDAAANAIVPALHRVPRDGPFVGWRPGAKAILDFNSRVDTPKAIVRRRDLP